MELSEAEKEDDKSAKTQMITRMALARFVSLKDFKGKRLLSGEPLLVFLHVLKQLLEQVMPEADAATRKQLLIHHFLTGLPTHMSRQLHQPVKLMTGEIAPHHARARENNRCH